MTLFDRAWAVAIVLLLCTALVLMASCADPRRFAREGSRDWCVEVGPEKCQ